MLGFSVVEYTIIHIYTQLARYISLNEGIIKSVQMMFDAQLSIPNYSVYLQSLNCRDDGNGAW
jgi:hypothetical protein